MSQHAAPMILPADAYLERLGAIRGTAGGLAVAVDPRAAPLLEPGPGSHGVHDPATHPVVLAALLLFRSFGSMRKYPLDQNPYWLRP